MAQKDDLRPRGDRRPKRLDERVRRLDGERDSVADILRADLAANELPRIVHRAVFVVSGENFIAFVQRQRPGNRVDADGGVRHKDQIIRVGVEVHPQFHTRCIQEIIVSAAKKLDGLVFQFPLPALVRLEDGFGARAKRAVIEKYNVWIEQKLIA